MRVYNMRINSRNDHKTHHIEYKIYFSDRSHEHGKHRAFQIIKTNATCYPRFSNTRIAIVGC